MRLQKALQSLSEVVPQDYSVFSRHISLQWICEALAATGTATVRKRRLPAEQVVWLVVAMALMRNDSILSIVDHLELALPSKSGKGVAPSAVSQARNRLGDQAMEQLFYMLGDDWAKRAAEEYRWRGMSVWLMDGSKLNVADTPSNRKYFGTHTSGRGESAYPMMRIVALMEARTHLIASARISPYKAHERHLAEDLWPEIPDNSISIVDKGLFSLRRMIPMERSGRGQQWLARARANLSYRVVEHLGRGEMLIEVAVPSEARKEDPSLPKKHIVRAIRYQHKGYRPQMLLTSLRDARKYPAAELVALYHERWEQELGYDELKTELLEANITLRSQTPVLVRQELWGVLLAYNLVRLEASRVAEKAGVLPTRISFVTVLRALRVEWHIWGLLRTPGTLPARLARLRVELARAVLPPRRRRSYPRTIKARSTKYPLRRARRRSSTGRSLK